jgi:hypothetical protein
MPGDEVLLGAFKVKFLSRALAAFAIMELSGCHPDIAAASVTDGTDDNGIDAFYYDRGTLRMYLVQSKWHENGQGTLKQGDCLKFLSGFEKLVKDFDLTGFNGRFQKRSTEISEAVRGTDTHFVLAIAHTGTQPIHDTIVADIQKLMEECNDVNDNMVSYRALDQSKIYAGAMGLTARSSIKLDIDLYEWGIIREPYTAYYGQIVLSDVIGWQSHGTALFDQNLRRVLPKTEVNDKIRRTLREDPNSFWYFNNGITVLCQSIQKERRGGSKREVGHFQCEGVAIINGAQTVGAIWEVGSGDGLAKGASLDETCVHARLIDLRSCPDDFGRNVTRAANTQNRFLGRDFAALDPNQTRLAVELEADGYKYTFKSGDPAPNGDNEFDITNATVALACAIGDVYISVLAKRNVGYFWDDIDGELYKKIFNNELEASHLLRAVKILRAIDRGLSPIQSNVEDPDRLVAIHGNRVVAQKVFQDLELRAFRDPNRECEALERKAELLAIQILRKMSAIVLEQFRTSYPQSLFKNTEKCKQIDLELSKNLNGGSANEISGTGFAKLLFDEDK